MRKYIVVAVGLAILLTMAVGPALAAGGFDIYGYNYQARIFVGPADGVDGKLDGTLYGDPTYANDHLVMKWSKAYEDARHGAAWTPDAWADNEWNGQVPGGSGLSQHCKMIWVGPLNESSQYWVAGGYLLSDEWEVIFDHYTGQNEEWAAHAIPTGYGAN